MKINFARVSQWPAWWWRLGAVLIAAVVILITLPWWWAGLNVFADRVALSPNQAQAEKPDDEPHDDHDGHDHGAEAPSIPLSKQARKNLALRFEEVVPQRHERFLTLPALVVERPGESRYQIVAPFTAIVTGVNVVPGEMVESSEMLFKLRLTHQDLVNAQKDFLMTLGELDVERKELARLEKIDSSVMARKTLLEKRYRIEILEADLKAQRNALHLHGLSTSQIDRIETERMLIREMTLSVPFLHHDGSVHGEEESEENLEKTSPSPGDHELVRQEFLVEDLDVRPGQAVQTGQSLCHLTDYQILYIEGRAFEQDAAEILEAAQQNRGVQAIPENRSPETTRLRELPIVRIANRIETDSRALHFYVRLPNQLEEDLPEGERQFGTWRYKPGQRMQLRVPVDVWENVFVLPVDAVAHEGAETYVFVENGNKLERRAVHVMYRDQFQAVIANDGSLFPRESVAQNAAHQLQLAVKEQSGDEGGGGHGHHGHMH